METYRGSCHCGKVRFEVRTELDKVVECNCSICAKKGAWHHRVPPERFTLLSGTEDLTTYRFNTGVARHCFCKHCGIHPFSHPRAAPDAVSVNLRCLDGVDLEHLSLERLRFDGRNWEEAAARLRHFYDPAQKQEG